MVAARSSPHTPSAGRMGFVSQCTFALMTPHRAFTLAEMLIVVLILGIMAGVAMPKIFGVNQKAVDADLRRTLAVVRNAIDRYAADNNGVYPGEDMKANTLKVQLKPFLREFPKNPVDADGVKADDIRMRNQGDPLVDHVAGTHGWIYDNQTGEFLVNTDALSSDGVTPYYEF
jgi:general secretion pathway protein G